MALFGKYQLPFATVKTTHSEIERLRQQLSGLQQEYRQLEDRNAELSKKLEISERYASTDLLTGISNRRITQEALVTDLSDVERNYFDLVVAQIDLDHFKNVNDTYGHEQGDAVLIGFTRAIQKHLRRSDKFGRWGGEEFILCLPMPPGTEILGIEDLFEKYQHESLTINRAPQELRKHEPLTISLGAVIIRSGAKYLDHQEILRQVDTALYESKKIRNTYTLKTYQKNSPHPIQKKLY